MFGYLCVAVAIVAKNADRRVIAAMLDTRRLQASAAGPKSRDSLDAQQNAIATRPQAPPCSSAQTSVVDEVLERSESTLLAPTRMRVR